MIGYPMAFSLRASYLGRIYDRLLQKHLLPHLEKSRLTPNQMTLVGCGIALLVPLGFFAHPLVGLLLILASGLADSLDGLMARRHRSASRFGAFLDSSLDRLSDFFYLCGFWVLFWNGNHQRLAGLMVFTALLTTVMISYLKARAEALGLACQTGLMERGARVIYLVVWAALIGVMPAHRPLILWLGLFLYLGLTLGTVAQRIRHVRRGLRTLQRNQEHAPPGTDA